MPNKNLLSPFEIRFIKNPPTTENLVTLYENAMYQELLTEFERKSTHKLNETRDRASLSSQFSHITRRYLILNIPFEEVLAEFEKLKKTVLEFTRLSVDFFSAQDDDTLGEFPAGEEPGEDDKPVVVKKLGVARTFMLDKFCEAYLLHLGDKERLLHYLKTTRMPGAKKYAGQIAKLYKQAIAL